MSTRHIFPLFLEGAPYAVGLTTGTMPVTGSYVTLTSTASTTIDVANGDTPGQMLNIVNTNGTAKALLLTNALSTAADLLTLGSTGTMATLMWNGTKWVTLAVGAGATAA